MITKEKARQIAKDIRASLCYNQQEFSKTFCECFFNFFDIDELGCTAFYWPLESEADPRQIAMMINKAGGTTCLPILQNGKREMLFAPWEEGDLMIKTDMAIMTPEHRSVDSVALKPQTLIVALLGINKDGQRIGFGKGHYDATLAALRCDGLNVTAIGLAYDEQFLDFEWDINAYDIPLDYLCTPTKVIKF